MSYSRDAIVSDIERLHVDVVRREDEHYGHIPFQTELRVGKDAVVYAHQGLLEEAQGSYIIDMTPEDVQHAFVTLSVVNALMRKRLEGAKVNQVVKFYTPLSSPDSLNRQILNDMDDGGIDESGGQFLLRALLEDEVVADPTRINAIRLAINASTLPATTTRSLELSAKTSLNFMLDEGRASYDQVLVAFGNESPAERARLFASSLQESMIAFAFPMPSDEADRLLELMPS